MGAVLGKDADVVTPDDGSLLGYARLSGGVLARAHVRTSNGAVPSGYLGDSDAGPEALAKFTTV